MGVVNSCFARNNAAADTADTRFPDAHELQTLNGSQTNANVRARQRPVNPQLPMPRSARSSGHHIDRRATIPSTAIRSPFTPFHHVGGPSSALGVDGQIRVEGDFPSHMVPFVRGLTTLMEDLTKNRLGLKFPSNFSEVNVRIEPEQLDDASAAYTTYKRNGSGHASEIVIGIPKEGLNDFSFGVHALTLLHEVVVHAHPDSWAASSGREMLSEEQEHRHLLVPDNFFHKAIKFVLPNVPEQSRVGFLRSYATSVEDMGILHLAPGDDDEPWSDEFKVAVQWEEEIKANVQVPSSDFWSFRSSERIDAPY